MTKRENKSIAMPSDKWHELIKSAKNEGFSSKNRYVEYLFDNRQAIKEVEELKAQLSEERKKITDWIMAGQVPAVSQTQAPAIEKTKNTAVSNNMKNSIRNTMLK